MSHRDKKFEHLIQAEIDGSISQAELSELTEAAAVDPTLRELRAELLCVARTLDGVESVEPPRELREEVLAAVLPAREQRRSRGPGWRARTVLPYGYAFAAGLALGIFGLHVATDANRTPEPAGIRGTMAPVGTLEHRSNLSFAGGALEVQSGRLDGLTAVELSLDSRSPVDIHLVFDADGMVFHGIEPAGDGPEVIEVSRGSIRLSGLSGSGGAIRFEPKEPGMMIELTVSRDAAVLTRGTVELP